VQSASAEHMPHAKFLQTCALLLQSAATWQLPVMQALPWQMWFGP